jgi:hypothetical protein
MDLPINHSYNHSNTGFVFDAKRILITGTAQFLKRHSLGNWPSEENSFKPRFAQQIEV